MQWIPVLTFPNMILLTPPQQKQYGYNGCVACPANIIGWSRLWKTEKLTQPYLSKLGNKLILPSKITICLFHRMLKIYTGGYKSQDKMNFLLIFCSDLRWPFQWNQKDFLVSSFPSRTCRCFSGFHLMMKWIVASISGLWCGADNWCSPLIAHVCHQCSNVAAYCTVALW